MLDKIKELVQNIQTFVGVDKVVHFGVCFFLTDVLVRRFDLPLLLSALIVMLIAFTKEYIDDDFSMEDLYADLLGILLYIM